MNIVYMLPLNWIEYLQHFLEAGIGYHIVDITFKNEKLIKNVLVVNQTIILNENVDMHDIKKILVTNTISK